MEILLASGNRHKQAEMQQIFSNHKILIPADLDIPFDPDETGNTYFDNAYIKAAELYRLSSKPVLADDSGLAVDALSGSPGIYSARYGNDVFGRTITSAERNAYLLSVLENVEARSARFVCCLVFMVGEHRYSAVQETVEGNICFELSGTSGFGYDPVFYVEEFGCTMAELSDQEKNSISHRGRAARKIHNIIMEE